MDIRFNLPGLSRPRRLAAWGVLLLTAALFPTGTARGQEASFQGLGDLPGGAFYSEASGVSADGSVVVGSSRSASGPLGEAFRWTEGESMQGLGDLPGGEFQSYALGVSADGSVVVGHSSSGDRAEAFRWEGGVMQGLGLLGDYGSLANDVSDDGSVVVGYGTIASGSEGFRWTQAGGMQGLGFIPGDSTGVAHDISADGTVVVGGSGYYDNTSTLIRLQAVRWQGGAPVGLGFPPGFPGSNATAASADGTVIVGVGQTLGPPFEYEASRWEDGVVQRLGTVPGYASSIPFDVSADGAVVVGYGYGTAGQVAFIWTETGSMRSLKEVLEGDYGLDLSGWTLASAEAVSADGTVIVGRGTNPQGDLEAWRAVLPPAAAWTAAVSGLFSDPVRWSINDVPTDAHDARFDAPSITGYTVSFLQSHSTRALTVDSSLVTLALAGHTYTLNTAPPAAGLRVGIAENRPAVLTIGGGTVAVQDAVLGEAPGSLGTLVVDGEGAALDVGGELTLGRSGSGNLGVLLGGAVTIEAALLMALEPGSEGHLTVDGQVQVVEGVLSVIGHEGAATATVLSAGTLSTTGPVYLGNAPGGEGELIFRTGSSGITFDTLYVGNSGRGGLSILGGGALTSANAVVGREAGSAGTMTVEGPGSHWVVSNTLRLGVGGVSVLFLRDGGTLSVNRVEIGPLSSADVSGGTITIGSGLPSKTAAAVDTGALSAEGGLLQADTLLLAEGATLAADVLVLNPGGVLGGGGTLELPAVNAGVLAPGGPGAPGVFALAVGYEQQAGGALEIELAGTSAGEYDALTVTGAAALGGVLRLRLLKGYRPEVGHTFEVVQAGSVTGTFDRVEAQEGIVADVTYEAATVTVTLTEVTTTPVEEPDEVLPSVHALEQNYPNPFNPATWIAFELPEAGPVRLVVYDLLGREVKALAEGRFGPGRHEVVLEAGALPSAVYVYVLQAGGQVLVRHMVLIK